MVRAEFERTNQNAERNRGGYKRRWRGEVGEGAAGGGGVRGCKMAEGDNNSVYQLVRAGGAGASRPFGG